MSTASPGPAASSASAGAPLRVGDLIEVAPVRTVIRLEEGSSAAAEIAATFVFTPEAAAHFSVISEALLAGRGQGYFLQGDFGSGKSHFLAALYAWLAGGEARDPLGEKHGGLSRLAASGKRFLPVAISLVNYRATTALESIVVGTVTERLRGKGAPAASTGAEGQQPEPLPPAQPEGQPEERLATFTRLITEVNEAGFDGLVLLVDELSEFFRSKPTPQALNEDARTLQLLGELSSGKPLWIVAAVQEAIEATGDVAQAILRKIKDRFPVRLELSTTHVRALIGGRLVRRKPGADEEIARIYEHYRAQFATFTAAFDDFRSAYPVHPATLALLVGLGDLFSQHRGIVDFVYSRIAGDPQRAIPGILDRPAAELLGPDSIYEHFSQRLAEVSAFHTYPRRIVPHLDEVIASALESEEDRALARRLVRMLVLYKLHPTADTPTVSQLAELSACSIGGAQPSLNVRYVAEAILDPVVRASRFLVRTLPASGDSLRAVYRIALEEDPGKLLEARLRTAMEEIAEDDDRLLVEPLAQLAESESWPGAAVWEDGARRSVSWSSSTRTALVRFLHAEEAGPFVDRLSFDVAEEGFDFALVLAISGRAADRAIDSPHTALWRVPRPAQSAVLREYLALRAIASRTTASNPADVPLLPLLKERIARIAPAAQQAAVEALYAGEFADGRMRVDPSVRQVRRFDRILEIAAELLLEARYPRFKEVAPRRMLPSPRLYQQLLEGFVAAGSVPLAEARSRSLAPLIEGLASPLGLVEIKRGAYVFSPDASGYPLIPHLLSQLSSTTPTPMDRALAGLTGSPFGLPRDTAVFLAASLVIGGLLAVRKGGRAIPLDYLNLQTVEKADEITLGELIAEADRETLVRECVFLPSVQGLESFGLRQQREAWKDVVKFRESALGLGEELRRSLGRMAEFSSFQSFGLAHLERTLAAMKALADSVRVSYPAKDGLEAFLRAWRGSGLASGELIALRKLAKFLAEKAEEFIFVNHYVRHPAVEKAAAKEPRLGELRSTILALLEAPEAGVVNDEGEHLQAVFGQLREAYGARYAQEHSAFYKALETPPLSHGAGRALDALRVLSGVEALDRPAGLEGFLRERAEGGQKQCRRRLSEELLRSPLCGCGFAIGDQPAPRRRESPEEAIDGFLTAYCAILASPRVLEAIAARAFALQDVQSSAAARLKRLSEILRRGSVSAAELAAAVDAETAAELGRALAGRIPIRTRSLATLAERLAGRRLPVRAILSMVSEWLAESSDDALIAVEADLEPSRDAPAGQRAASFWPLLHGTLLARLARPADVAGWELTLERELPSAGQRAAFLAADSTQLFGFISTESLHTEAIRAAWLLLAERTVAGRPLPDGFTPRSRHADAAKARRIAGLLADLGRAATLATRSFPERLRVRIPLEELLFDPWTTEELSSAIYRSLADVTGAADSWVSTLPAVQPIPLAGSPVVLIADGVPADVWMEAMAKGPGPAELSGAQVGWSRLEAAPSTQESIAALFSLTGDPQEQLWLRDIPLLTLKGIEEKSLKERLLPLAPGRPVVARLTLFDQAAHARRLRLSEMAAALAEIAGRDLPPVVRACAAAGRELILTTDHGLSLTKDGLTHGRGGAWERLIFRAHWRAATAGRPR